MEYFRRRDRHKLAGSAGNPIAALIADYDARIKLPHSQKKRMLRDALAAAYELISVGVAPEEVAKRLSADKLGDFYLREDKDAPGEWYPLDNAAKIYPLSMRRCRISIYRLSMYLRENVSPALLQMALSFTIQRFPYYAATLKNGFFWNYIECARKRYALSPELPVPCRVLNVSTANRPGFRAICYHERISVEFFHTLTDGTGALTFLTALTAEYLRLKGHEVSTRAGLVDTAAPPRPEEWADDFLSVDPDASGGGFMDKPAIQMKGRLSARKPEHILHFDMNAEALRALAKQKGVSVTCLILGLMFLAARETTPRTAGRFQIQVPVNMRKFYASSTMRNFSLYCSVRLEPGEIDDLDGILPKIAAQLTEGASQKSLEKTLAYTNKLVDKLRGVPLILKRPGALFAYSLIGEQAFTSTLSNLGVADLPEDIRPHVRKMDFILGTASINRASLAMVTCGGVATLSITKQTADEAFERAMAFHLRALGIEIDISGSEMRGKQARISQTR